MKHDLSFFTSEIIYKRITVTKIALTKKRLSGGRRCHLTRSDDMDLVGAFQSKKKKKKVDCFES